MEGGFPAALIYEDLEFLSPYMHTSNDIVGLSLNSPELLEASARLGGASVATFAGLGREPEPRFLRGDANADLAIDISDTVHILDVLFAKEPEVTCLDSADSNDDGQVDLGDAIRILFLLFASQGPLPEPSATCGLDPTADGLDCISYPSC